MRGLSADLVGLTGMIVQRKRIREIPTAVKKLNVFTVVGGPWVTVQEDYFGGLSDAVFIGEAEETWPRFLEEWKQVNPGKRYQQEGPSDMTRVPPPRLDLHPENYFERLDGLLHNVPDPELRREYRRRIFGMARARRDPAVLFGYVLKCAMHYHHCRMGRDMVRDESAIVNPY